MAEHYRELCSPIKEAPVQTETSPVPSTSKAPLVPPRRISATRKKKKITIRPWKAPIDTSLDKVLTRQPTRPKIIPRPPRTSPPIVRPAQQDGEKTPVSKRDELEFLEWKLFGISPIPDLLSPLKQTPPTKSMTSSPDPAPLKVPPPAESPPKPMPLPDVVTTSQTLPYGKSRSWLHDHVPISSVRSCQR